MNETPLPRHPLLARQLRRHFGGEAPEPLAEFLDAVDEAYRQSDTDRLMLERSLELSSRELLKANSEMRAVLQAFPDIFFWLDPSGRISAVHAENQNDLMVPASDLIGRQFSAVSDAGSAEKLETTLQAARDSGTLASVEYGLTLGGDRQFFEARVLPMVRQTFLAIVRNITARTLTKAELCKARDAAEAATAAKDEFLATMSHEIRTPMNAVVGFTGLLLNSDLNEEQRDYLQLVKASGESLLLILNDILDFSKIEARKLDLESVVFEPRAVINDSASLFKAQLAGSSLYLTVDIHDEVPMHLVGDPGRLRQVLLNLINNAVKFTPRGAIAVRARASASLDNRTELRFEVEDEGIGISSEGIARLFQPFTQADLSSTRKHGGTGLGLAICRALVELMDGTIDVESQLDAGSVFWFTIAFENANPEHVELHESSNSHKMECLDARSARALVVEDNPANQKLAARTLEGMGHQVDIVTNGREAIDAVERSAYDIVLMDCRMPEMDGYEATRLIRAREGNGDRHLPIIGITANAQSHDRQVCLEAGMDDYLSKPFQVDDIRALISRWLNAGLADGRAA